MLLLLGNHRAHYFSLVPAQNLQSQNMAQYFIVWPQMRSHLALFPLPCEQEENNFFCFAHCKMYHHPDWQAVSLKNEEFCF